MEVELTSKHENYFKVKYKSEFNFNSELICDLN